MATGSQSNTSRVALITGASRGLGLTVAGFLAGAGYNLIVTARGSDALADAATQLKARGARVTALAGDVADAAHRRRLAEAARAFGRLDVLVNNASELGPSPLKPLAELPLETLSTILDTNVVAALGLVQATLPLLKAGKGLIVNLSSDAALGGYEGWGGYGTSKAALDLLSLTLAHELSADGIGVVAVDPGEMNTAMLRAGYAGEDVSDRPLPDVTLPFWAWLFGQERLAVSGRRYQAQAETWETIHETR